MSADTPARGLSPHRIGQTCSLRLPSISSQGALKEMRFPAIMSISFPVTLFSEYFWHFTGLGTDEKINPEKVEHLGITPLEAMASGCLTFCYKAGGPKELIKDNDNGFLFSNVDDLVNKMIKVNSNETIQKKVIAREFQFVQENFSYEVFKRNVLRLI